MVAEQLPQRDNQQIADRVVMQISAALEPMLENISPRTPPFVVTAQGRERHPQITWW